MESNLRRISRRKEVWSNDANSLASSNVPLDQMYRIEDDLDTIQENMKVSDRLIRSINSIKGSIVNAFSSKKSEPPSVTEDRIQFEREKNRERERKVEQEIAEYHGKDKNAVPEKEAEEEEKVERLNEQKLQLD